MDVQAVRRSGGFHDWLARNQDQLVLGVLFLAAGTAIPLMINGIDLLWVLLLSNLSLVAIILLQRVSLTGYLEEQRASSDAFLVRVREVLSDELGITWKETEYSRRRNHFVQEKARLAEHLVTEVLPSVIKGICSDSNATAPRVRLILDSGTTLTPVFRELVRHGISKGENHFRLEIFTNSLAGVDEVEKHEDWLEGKLREEDFTLIGGTPLSRYRATTGAMTQSTLHHLFDREHPDNEGVVTVGVLTANWFLVGQNHDRISLCARGRGHPEFKRVVADGCDILILISPLGKILALNDVERLHDLMPPQSDGSRSRDRYAAIPISRAKAKTFLVTSRRPDRGGGSPLGHLSSELFRKSPALFDNFSLWERCPTYIPGGSRDEIRSIELPHIWTRQHTPELFGEV